MRIKIIYCIIIVLAICSCVSEFNIELSTETDYRLVVEGNIIADSEAIFYIGLSTPLGSSGSDENSIKKVSGAKLFLIDNEGHRSEQATMIEDGLYSLKIGTLLENTKYGIEIQYINDTYQSEPDFPLWTPEVNASWVQPEKEGDVVLQVSTTDSSDGYKYYMWYYQEDWEIQANYRNRFYYDPLINDFYELEYYPYYYCWEKHIGKEILVGNTEALTENSIINKKIFTRNADDIRFSMLYAVTVQQIAITKDAYEYFYNVNRQNTEMGGLFTPQPSDVQGNIKCITNPDKKVIGNINVAMNITESRKFLKEEEISRPPTKIDCIQISEEDMLEYMADNNYYSYKFVYDMGFRPVGVRELEDGIWINYIYFWTYNKCTECTAMGGTKDKPLFWPNDHE